MISHFVYPTTEREVQKMSLQIHSGPPIIKIDTRSCDMSATLHMRISNIRNRETFVKSFCWLVNTLEPPLVHDHYVIAACVMRMLINKIVDQNYILIMIIFGNGICLLGTGECASSSMAAQNTLASVLPWQQNTRFVASLSMKKKIREKTKNKLISAGLEHNANVSVVTTCDVFVEEKEIVGQLSHNLPPPWLKLLAFHTDAKVDGCQGGSPQGLNNCQGQLPLQRRTTTLEEMLMEGIGNKKQRINDRRSWMMVVQIQKVKVSIDPNANKGLLAMGNLIKVLGKDLENCPHFFLDFERGSWEIY
ncbi:hypothetical protein E1301_Tti012625 [Triplophysa tibetana]|uniref:Uncharacterized protein n=1 Tax=Triplophysa tibetana TaxID=1572043 RepID=A0A5A9NM81_9TELE|nr:hypothetical protein E1301_Tti012625 [Triplophysa tibetana]